MGTETLYDVHTHVGADPGFMLRGWWPYCAGARDLLREMDAAGIGRAVAFPFTLPSAFDTETFVARGGVELKPSRFPFDRENALLADEVRLLDAGKRLIQFAMFDPAREPVKQAESLRALIASGVPVGGLKCQTTVLQSPIKSLMSEGGRQIMAIAAEHNLPLLFHTSVNPSDSWAQVADCLEVAAAYPALRFNLAHSLRFSQQGLEQAARMPNVWVDCSAHLVHCQLARDDHKAVAARADRVDADYARPAEVLAVVHEILRGKYLWGSDNPYMSWCDQGLRAVYSYEQEAAVLHSLPPDVKRSMASAAPEAWLFGKTS